MTDREMEDPLDSRLAAAVGGAPLEAPSLETPSGHLEDLSLVAYLDGRLSGDERETLEAHLAACDACRELAAESAAAVEAAVDSVPEPSRRPFWGRMKLRPAWAAAALVALLTAAPAFLWLRGAAGPDLEAFGVTSSEAAAAGPDLARRARRLASGSLGPSPGLEDLTLAEPGTALRARQLARPEPLAPRWSSVLSTRPRLDWVAVRGFSEVEVLIVDADENLVGSAPLLLAARGGELEAPPEESASTPVGATPVAETPVAETPVAVTPAVTASEGMRSDPYPAELPDLEPGRLYAWRVSVRIDDEWVASPFVPFRVLAEAERSALQVDLGAAGDDPMLRAAAYVAAGADREALAALARLAAATADADRVARLVERVLRRHRLPETVLADEASRILGARGER